MKTKLLNTKLLKYAKKIKAIKLLGNKCECCGNENIFNLTFHHKDDNKEFNISQKKELRWSILEKEIKKCILLCENCHRELHYNKIENDKDRKKDKMIYLDYKGYKCEKCGYDKCYGSLSFHHKDPEIKNFNIGSLTERMNSIDDLNNIIKKELDKCDLLCMNCHREEHVNIEFFEKYKTEIYRKMENLKEIQPKLDRILVYEMYDSGIKQVDIAKHFNASKGTISGIIKNRNN